MRILMLLTVALAIGGCTNMVFSDRPLFHRADSRGAPSFRPGVWAAKAGDCVADLSRPLQDWPACALGIVHGRNGPEDIPGEVSFRVVAGDPPVLQQAYFGTVLYGGLRPLEHDERGRVTAYEAWVALCGPPPPPRTTGAASITGGQLTLELLPGLEADDSNCRARRSDAVRRSVAQSRPWQQAVVEMRWMRERTAIDRYPAPDGRSGR